MNRRAWLKRAMALAAAGVAADQIDLFERLSWMRTLFPSAALTPDVWRAVLYARTFGRPDEEPGPWRIVSSTPITHTPDKVERLDFDIREFHLPRYVQMRVGFPDHTMELGGASLMRGDRVHVNVRLIAG